MDTTETPAVEAEVETTETPAVEAEVVAVEEPAAAPQPAPTFASDRVALAHPEKIGCSFAGHAFEANADGVILVPAFAVADLTAHGFVPVKG